MTQVQHLDDLPRCPGCERSDYLMRWDTNRADWLCSNCQRMYHDDQMLEPLSGQCPECGADMAFAIYGNPTYATAWPCGCDFVPGVGA